jgi:hypothetical protein
MWAIKQKGHGGQKVIRETQNDTANSTRGTDSDLRAQQRNSGHAAAT